MPYHYSLFHCDDRSGNPKLINLDCITHISLESGEGTISYFCYTTSYEAIELCPVDGERLIDAWNLFLQAKHATHHVIPHVGQYGPEYPRDSIRDGLRIEKLLLEAIAEFQQSDKGEGKNQ
jgi:hypothetical protein